MPTTPDTTGPQADMLEPDADLCEPADSTLAALAAILDEHPADMLTRQMYADRLREQGYERLADAWEWLNREGKVPWWHAEGKGYQRIFLGWGWWGENDTPADEKVEPINKLPYPAVPKETSEKQMCPLFAGHKSAATQLRRAAIAYAEHFLALKADC